MRSRPSSQLPAGTPPPRRHPWRALARAASWHRRKLAVLATVAAVLSGLAATAPPPPPSASVVRATAALAAGSVVRTEDVETVAVADEVVPDDAVIDVSAIVGHRLAGPVTRGEILTSVAVVSPRTVSAPNHVLAPIRLADADQVALLRTGDLVDVLAVNNDSGRAATVATKARVVTIPVLAADGPSAETGALVVLDVDRASVPALTLASTGSRLSVVWS